MVRVALVIPGEQEELMQLLRNECAKDRINTRVIDMTGLNLVEMTRKKVHRSLAEQVRLLPV